MKNSVPAILPGTILSPLCCLCCLGGLSSPALAYPWTAGSGTDANWDNPANWGGTVPTAADSAEFSNGSYLAQPTVNVPSSVLNLRMTSTSGGVTITAANDLTLNLSGNTTDATIDLRGATAGMTINGNAVLAGSSFHKFGVAAGRTLTINGNITGGKRLDITGDQAGDPLGNNGSGGTVALNGASHSGIASVFLKIGTLQINTFNGLTSTFTMQGTTTTLPTIRYTGGTETSNWKPALKLRTPVSHAAIEASGTGTLTLSNTANLGFSGDAQDAPVQLVLAGDNTGDNTLSWGLVNGTSNKILSLVKAGAGTWVLTGNKAYTGSTSVKQGKLKLGATGAIGQSEVIDVQSGATLDVLAQAGGWALGASQTLKGTGSVTGSIIGGTGTVSPGASTGNLAVSVDANLAGSTLEIEIDDAQSPRCDKLSVAGALDISGAKLNLTVSGTPAQSAYVIASYGSLNGTFATITPPLPAGYIIDYDHGGNQIAIIQESATNTFAAWLAGYPPATGFETDSDHDGNPNGIENILGTNPNLSSPGLTKISATSSSTTFQHALNPAAAADVTASYQWSTDLVQWLSSGQTNSGGTTATIIPSGPVGNVVTVTIEITSGPAAKLFGRLVATRN